MDPPLAHPDKHPHIHTEECNNIWRNLINCRNNRSVIERCIGVPESCSSLQIKLERCYKKERLSKRARSYKLSEKTTLELIKKEAIAFEDKI